MGKRDLRAMHMLTLDCGHRRPGPSGAGTKRCAACRSMQKVVHVGDLVRPEQEPLQPTGTPVERKDGLTIRHFDGSDMKIWWCRFCWGDSPQKAYRRRAGSMGEVFPAWDAHKVTVGHRRQAEIEKRWSDAEENVLGE